MNTLKFIGVLLLVRKTNEIWISSQLLDEVHVTTYFDSEPNFKEHYFAPWLSDHGFCYQHIQIHCSFTSNDLCTSKAT